MKRFAPTLATMLAAVNARTAPTVPAPQWARHFASQGVTGTFVLFEPSANRMLAFDEARAKERWLPASTFEIAIALIGLEAGAVADEREVFRCDGKPKRYDAWERNHTIASAMQENVVWVFQAIARRVGKPARGGCR
jgi:beta-lactamase class D